MSTIIDGKSTMIIGGWNGNGKKTVWVFDHTTGEYKDYPELNFSRYYLGCTKFNSRRNGQRPIVVAAGGFSSNSAGTVEMIDYTLPYAKWKISKFQMLTTHSS